MPNVRPLEQSDVELGSNILARAFRDNPGMVGIIPAGAPISHSVLSDVPVKALVIWTPGGEVESLLSGPFQEKPLEGN